MKQQSCLKKSSAKTARENTMFCVEINLRHPGDLGVSVVVLARDPLEAVGKVRRMHPEYIARAKKNGRVYEIAHLEIDWDSGRTFITRKKLRICIC